MARIRPRNPRRREDVRYANRQTILRLLWSEGQASRADLARAVGLTPATVSSIAKELLDDGLVDELGQVTGSVGKPATLLGIVPDAINFISVDVSATGEINGAIVDWTGKIVQLKTIERNGTKGIGVVNMISGLIKELEDGFESDLFGIGVAVPGLIRHNRTVVRSAHLGWDGLALADTLSTVTDLPVFVANDAHAAAFGELIFGEPKFNNLMLVKIDAGVGLGLVFERTLFHGDNEMAGEIGHVTVVEDGIECACGRRGCLETVVTVPLAKLRKAGVSAEECADELREAGTHLGRGLAMLLGALNMADVVVAGHELAQSETFRTAVSDEVRRLSLEQTVASSEVRTGTLGSDAVLFGATGLVFNQQLGIN